MNFVDDIKTKQEGKCKNLIPCERWTSWITCADDLKVL